MGSHKTKNQLEIELNELKQLYGEKCSECDFLTKDNRAKSEAVTNACADLKNLRKDLEDARAELQTKEVCNKKLADQFYDYRNELVKVRKDLAEAIEKRDSLKVELEGVRGALKRESELREHAENENKMLRNERNEVEKIQRKHNKLTLEDIDNALRQWNYIDGKLSHDLCMPLESLIQLLDEYGVNDFCKLRERLMYGPTTDYSNALANVRKLEKENMDLKAVADDLEKQRRELEQKLVQEHNVSMVQEARVTDLEGQLRRQTDNCKYWTDRAFRDEEELKKSMEHDRIAQENFEKAARRNDELQNEVNKLQQRWTDTFNPEDELLGRKVLEWQEINVTMAKHNIENAMVLESELGMLKEYRKVLDKHGIMGPPYLDKRLSQSCPEKYMEVFSKYGIDSAERLDQVLGVIRKIKQAATASKLGIVDWCYIVDIMKDFE